MKRTHKVAFTLLFVAGLLLAPRASHAVLIDFEAFSDADTPSGPGVTFTNATVITAGISLDEIEFPPHSGVNVAFDNGSPMILSFSSPFAKVSGFFTYTDQITLLAFDGPNGTGNQIGMAMSMYSENFTSSFDPMLMPPNSPNEMIMIGASGIRSLTIAGDPGGTSFTLDDFTGTSAVIPEPATLVLLGSGLAGLWGSRLRRSRKPLV